MITDYLAATPQVTYSPQPLTLKNFARLQNHDLCALPSASLAPKLFRVTQLGFGKVA